MPRSEPDPLAALTEAVLSLAEQIRRYNDAHEPIQITGTRTADLFSARYGEQEREKDEMHETLVALEAARNQRRPLAGSKRRSA